MDSLPLEIEKIILNYKYELEVYDKYKKVLNQFVSNINHLIYFSSFKDCYCNNCGNIISFNCNCIRLPYLGYEEWLSMYEQPYPFYDEQL